MATAEIYERVIKNTHLLLVDDEENIRLSLSLIARRAGYRVSIEADGRDALGKIIESGHGPDRIDVLVIDIQMPGLSGIELYSEFLRQDLGIPIVFMSGYRYREVITGLNMDGNITFLEKPFQPDEFLDHVERVIKSIPCTSNQDSPIKGGRQR